MITYVEAYTRALLAGWRLNERRESHSREALAVSATAYKTVTGLVGLAAKLGNRFQHWRDRRVTLRALTSLDDHLLRDIGIERDRIPDVVEETLAARERAERELAA